MTNFYDLGNIFLDLVLVLCAVVVLTIITWLHVSYHLARHTRLKMAYISITMGWILIKLGENVGT